MIIRRRGTSDPFSEEEAYRTRASSRMEKSSSGVQDVLLTKRRTDPLTIASAKSLVSGMSDRKEVRRDEADLVEDEEDIMGWKMAAGRSCMATMGDLIL